MRIEEKSKIPPREGGNVGGKGFFRAHLATLPFEDQKKS
jgi:hypothetical protein